MKVIRVVPTDVRYAAGFQRALDLVARERKHLAFLEGPPVDTVAAFVQNIMNGAGVQVLALDSSDTVVGWCDIVRNSREGFRHNGILGMGLLSDYRGQGHGTRLLNQAIGLASKLGLERIELEVFGSNAAGIRLYQKLGFATEGIKRGARHIDGIRDDVVLMALTVDTEQPAEETT